MSLQLIDVINEEFIQSGIRTSSRDYKQYLESVIEEVNKLVAQGKRPSKKEINRIIREVELRQGGFNKSLLMYLVLSGVTMQQFKSKKSPFTKRRTKKINNLLKIVKPNSRTFTRDISQLTRAYLDDAGKNFKGKKLKAFNELSDFFNSNEKTIARIKKETFIDRRRMNTLVKRNLSKGIFNDYKKFISKKTSLASIQKQLTLKYTDTKRIKRIVDTETHALAEQVKKVHAQSVGMENKTWRTQGDARVRDLPNSNHRIMDGVTIPIEDKFNLQGHRADAPGDINLPPEQRIGCRCYLTFS